MGWLRCVVVCRRIVRAQELEDTGEYMEAMKLWRAAYKICPRLEEPSWNSNGASCVRACGSLRHSSQGCCFFPL